MKFLLTLILSFIIIVFSVISLNEYTLINKNIEVTSDKEIIIQESNPPLTPILKENASFPLISAQSVLALDIDSGAALYEKDPDAQLLPASTTKIVTALVALDYYPLDEDLTVGNISVEGQKMHLVENEKISVKNLLYGLLVYSANDAAEVLAQSYPGGRESFITAMNLKAEELSLDNTFFKNPTGLDGDGQVTTAKDLARVSSIAMQNTRFREIVGTKEIEVKSIDGKIAHKLVNINELLGKVEGVLGVKTGWTENARENLVTYMERYDKKIIIVILGSQDRFGETEELINWIFENYEWKRIAS